jgi:hypothetical protein
VTPQTCAQFTTLVGGSIQLTLLTGVTYTITGPNGVVAFDPVTGLATGLDPGAYNVSFVLDPTYSTAVVSPIPLTVVAYTGPCGVKGDPAAVATDESCLRSVLLVDGYITVDITTGVNYTITGPGGGVAFDPVTGQTAGIPSGAYTVTFTLDPGYITGVACPIPVTINPYGAACAPIPITPAATPTDQTCVLNVFLTDGFIQLTLDPAITYTITDAAATVIPFDPVTGLTGPIPPGTYSL